jgi:hypothetical protein
MQREHLTFTFEGLRLLISRTKATRRAGALSSACRAAPDAVRVVEVWLQASDCRYGLVFRHIDIDR